MPPSYTRHSVYKSVDTSHHFGMATDSFDRLRSGNTANRLSVNVNSDNSLDFPVHRFVDKEVVNYYKKNNRSGEYFNFFTGALQYVFPYFVLKKISIFCY